MIEIARNTFRIGSVNSPIQTLREITGVYLCRGFPEKEYKCQMYFSDGSIAVYDVNVSEFNIDDILNLRIDYIEQNGDFGSFLFKNRFKVI